MVTLIEFNPDQLVGFGCVLDVVSCREESASGKRGRRGREEIVTAVVREYRRITSCEVECSGYRTTEEDGSAGLTFVEVEPFLSLEN